MTNWGLIHHKIDQSMNPYHSFLQRFELFASKHPQTIVNTLSNIFTMREIGNKTHGDMAEVGLAEFIEQFLYDYRCIHVGKERFRAKKQEEDIVVKEELTGVLIPISLKAYGDGPLQLSTDKNNTLYPFLQQKGNEILDVAQVLNFDGFQEVLKTNVMPLIYREDKQECNIMVFDFPRMLAETSRIVFIGRGCEYDYKHKQVLKRSQRKHPIYLFLNSNGEYICEVRYGGASANALQRGLWTHTKKSEKYFKSITGGWVSYSKNIELVRLIRLALNSSPHAHKDVNVLLQDNINTLKSVW